MAIRDFKEYLYTVQSQVLEMKEDLTDFEQALKDGFITEDKLEEVKIEAANIETNYQRLLYVAYLLELPQRKTKHVKYKKINANLEKTFSDTKADLKAVVDENKSALDNLRQSLKKLKDEK